MPREQSYDHLIKLLIVGNSGVGKTNMLLRFCENNFMTSHLATIGIDFKTKTVQIDGKKIRMQIWDTAGQERFKTITQTYYRGAMGILMIYAVNDRQSFDEMENWFRQIKTHASDSIVKILIGNKVDSNKREVTSEQGQALAKELGVPFYQTSAKTGENIEDSFMEMAKEVKNRVIEQSNEVGVVSYTGSILMKSQSKVLNKNKDKCCQ